MDYLRYKEELERLQKGYDRMMYLQLINLVKAVGMDTDKEELKKELRPIYVNIKSTPNPYRFADGSIVNRKAHDKLQELIIVIIDLLDDHYGNYKMLK